MDNNKTPDIVLTYPSEFPSEIIEREILNIQSDKLNLKILKENHDPFCAFEWVIPTAFGVYILKPYFDSFLSEAGKDHYIILKSGLKKIIEKAKFIKARLISASQSSEKLSKDYNQSVVISLIIETKNGREIKLLFDNDLDKSDWDGAIDQLLDFVIENYESHPNDQLTSLLADKSKKIYESIYVIIDPNTKKIEFQDEMDLVKKYK